MVLWNVASLGLRIEIQSRRTTRRSIASFPNHRANEPFERRPSDPDVQPEHTGPGEV